MTTRGISDKFVFDELVQEIADQLYYQLQTVGPTPRKTERLADAVRQAAETGKVHSLDELNTLVRNSRDDNTRGTRPSATLNCCVVRHLEELEREGVTLNPWSSDHFGGFHVVAEAMLRAMAKLKSEGLKPGHKNPPMTAEAVRSYWNKRNNFPLELKK